MLKYARFVGFGLVVEALKLKSDPALDDNGAPVDNVSKEHDKVMQFNNYSKKFSTQAGIVCFVLFSY